MTHPVLLGLAALLIAGGAACERLSPEAKPGLRALVEHDCGACHRIAGVPGAEGWVGPPLDDYGRRLYVAGVLPNNRDNLARFIADPVAVRPRTAMPDLGIDLKTARQMATFLLDEP